MSANTNRVGEIYEGARRIFDRMDGMEMAYMGLVLELIEACGLTYALGRVLEEIAEGAVAEDEEDAAAHLKCAAYFLGRELGDGASEVEEASAETAPVKAKAGGNGRRSGGNPQSKPTRQCDGCGDFKGVTAFEKKGRTCRRCRNAAAAS